MSIDPEMKDLLQKCDCLEFLKHFSGYKSPESLSECGSSQLNKYLIFLIFFNSCEQKKTAPISIRPVDVNTKTTPSFDGWRT